MKKSLIRLCLFAFFFVAISNVAEAQKGKKRSSTKRGNTTVRKSTKGKTKATVSPSAQIDSTAAVAKAPEPAVVLDSLPIVKVKNRFAPMRLLKQRISVTGHLWHTNT
ncbi:MAG: hypothetical protein IPP72_03430 [Chitinophagaceae bacterium]|nr:hypothetical protein [Chitinophagaceae bacterium]